MKTVTFNNRPKPADTAAIDRWVAGGEPEQRPVPIKAPAPVQEMKRFTIDVPADLHRRIKADCAEQGIKMADLVREMLEIRFPAKS